MKIFFAAICIILSSTVSADPAVLNGWQWNNNVKIKYIYSYWSVDVNTSHNQHNLMANIELDNGEFCFLNSEDKALYSLVLTMKAQNAAGQIVCSGTPQRTLGQKDSRRVHRIKY